MKIEYKNSKLEKICTNARDAEKAYGQVMAGKIQQRIDEISASASVEMMIRFKIGRCHPLKQNKKGQFAVDLIHPHRLIFNIRGDKV